MARAARKTGVELGMHIAGLAWSHPATARLRGGIVAATTVSVGAAEPPRTSSTVASVASASTIMMATSSPTTRPGCGTC